MKTFFYFLFWSSPPNLRAKSIPKEDNIGFGAKYSPDCCGIPKASGLGCVSVLQKVFLPPPSRNSLLWRRACCCTVLAVHKLYCGLRPHSHLSYAAETAIIAFSLKRCCSKSTLLKSVLSVQIGRLLATLFAQFWFRKNWTSYDKIRQHICELRQNVKKVTLYVLLN